MSSPNPTLPKTRLLVPALSAPALLLFALDTSLLLPKLSRPELPPVVGYLWISALIMGGAGFCGYWLLKWFATRLRASSPLHAQRWWWAVFVVGALPGLRLAKLMTAGKGISSSSWRIPVYLTTQATVTAVVILLVYLLRSTPEWSRKRGVAVGATAIGLGAGAIFSTSFHSTTYLNLYLGVLIIGSVLLAAGFAWSFHATDASSAGGRTARGLLLGAATLSLGLAYALTRQGGHLRARIGLLVFSEPLVAPKLAPLLFRISPIYTSRSASLDKLAFRGTRLDVANVPAAKPRSPGALQGYNFVLVSADAFRADVLGDHPRVRTRTPSLERLAQQSTVFTQAIADYSHTSRSLLSILSGRWDINLAREKSLNRNAQDLENRTRLPRILRQSGYFTLASMPGARKWKRFFDSAHIAGFDQHVQAGGTCIQQVEHFQHFVEDYPGPKPFFFWMHIFDSHTPLQHPQTSESFAGQPELEYAATVEHVDTCVGSVVAALEKTRHWDRTVLVFMSDHGEALGEHKRMLKHSTCYLHDIRIPMIIRAPGLGSPRTLGYRFQPSDLLPTVANLLGISLATETVEGDDLSGLFDEKRPVASRGMAFSGGLPDQYPCVSVMRDSWHLIYTPSGQFYELYDIDADPQESNNLIASNGNVVEQLRSYLDPYYAHYRVQELSESLLE